MDTERKPEQWIRDGKTVYLLHQVGWHKGEPLMTNKFSFQVYPDYRMEDAEKQAEEVAEVIKSILQKHQPNKVKEL
jgi:hypothetical protein